MTWRTGNDTDVWGYRFRYYPTGWLRSASTRLNGRRVYDYDTFYDYDKMGNMEGFYRYGVVDKDLDLYDFVDYPSLINYDGNQVTRIDDNDFSLTYPYNGGYHFIDYVQQNNEYVYDKNGNMTQDLNQRISSIQYNLLNLPTIITYSTGSTIAYTYDAAGKKLHVAYGSPSSTTDYCGNMIYENGALKQILIDDGYVTFSGTTPVYHYYLKDHQGNNRVVMNASGTIEQVNHYFPFGYLYGESTNASTQPYKYNGKEFDMMHGLHWYDYGARHYDPCIMRFTTMDPMCEKYYHLSPYAYCGNNPVNAVDPSGMDWVQKEYEDYTEYYYDRNVKSQADIDKLYGKNSGITYINNNSEINIDGTSFSFINDLKDNKYGYVIKEGEKLDNSNIYYGENYTIFGTSDNSVDAKTLHKNYLGTSYTGPNNPKTYLGKDSYQYIPQNRSEYGSYIHDLLYDKAKAVGVKGALWNTSQEVIDADFFLARYNYLNMMNSQTPIIDRGRSALTAPVFMFVAGYKTLFNVLKK